MTAEDIMTAGPVTATDTTSIADALEMLEENDIRHLPVVRDDAVVGMLSDRDLRGLGMNLIRSAENLDALRGKLTANVGSLMTGGVITVDADASLRDVIDLFLDEKVGAVPVVESGTARLVGIISYIDVLREARDQMD